MTYNPLIPQPTDNLSTSQGQMLVNFGQLNTLYDIDHYAWDNATVFNRGRHKSISFPLIPAAPAPIAPATVAYPAVRDASNQLLFANGPAATDIYQVTSNVIAWTPRLCDNAGTAYTPGAGSTSYGRWWRYGKGIMIFGRISMRGITLPAGAAVQAFIDFTGGGTAPPTPTISGMELEVLEIEQAAANLAIPEYAVTVAGIARLQTFNALDGLANTFNIPYPNNNSISFYGYYE